MEKRAIIIGAGPAGLTAAYELLTRTDIKPIILEKSGAIGGISKTVNYKGNRMDIGGHRFFSKSDRVMKWWLNIMPLAETAENNFTISYQNKTQVVSGSSTGIKDENLVMLVRKRLSRIYFLRQFFTYPISLSIDTLRKLGVARTASILVSYLKAQAFPRKPEKSLEDFMINRFGITLYELFFRDYTEKVWGVPCNEIPAEWGAQRIKGVSIRKAIEHAVKEVTRSKRTGDISQKDTETSLIEQFLYPKLGPGQLWEEVARQVQQMGGVIHMQYNVKEIVTREDNVTAILAENSDTGEPLYLEGDYFFSTMPVKELIANMGSVVPSAVQEIAAGLQYRDFITVGILLSRMSSLNKETGEWKALDLKDNWIYIQDAGVKVGRLQIFNNWSPYMVADPSTVWVGMEFFCNETDAFWKLPDEEIAALAVKELEKIGLAAAANVLDSTVLRVEKTYPAYFGAYERFDEVREFTDRFKNLFLVGRNGMHKYNNADHSMLTAMVAVDNIEAGVEEKENVWGINTEQEYHEEKKAEETVVTEILTPVQPTSKLSLKDYIFKEPENRPYVWTAIIGIIAQLLFFKYFYPFASFINGDSYAYLETAYHNLSINTYPIGYSKFLRLFSVFTKSDTALVVFQYLLLQASILSFVFTLFYFYKPSKIVKIGLFGFMLFNPVFLYLANYVSSDTLFLSLSLIWFNLLLWIVYRPSTRLLVFHALVLFLAFTIRYNALYYPLIAGVAFLLSKQKLLFKTAGLSLCIVLIGGFVLFTSNKYYELAGKRQFTPFTGWQMANNAMYAYKFVDSSQIKQPPAKFRVLDKMIRTYFDTTRNNRNHPEEELMASTIYMWTPTAPLRQYMQLQFKKDSTAGEQKRWATVAPLYKEYGTYLIKQYPAAFTKYYLFPNALKYYAPPVEFLESYSTGVDSVSTIAQAWFGYKTNKITTEFKDFKVNVLNFYPVMVGTMNVIFFLGMLSFLFLQGYKQYKLLGHALLLVVCLWLVNFGFSVFASPIALRFQLFPILVMTAFAFLFMEYLVREASAENQA